MESKKLFLLDAYALIFRAYYALIKTPRFSSGGFNTSAIFGFVNTLQDILKKENPTHIAVCFDPAGPTFRHEAYEKYKAEREATPEDIKKSIPYIKQIISAYRIPIVEVAGYEADDVIGTLAHKAQGHGFTTYMMTPDKDFGQLVTDNVFIYKPGWRGGEFEVRGVREVCAKYELDNPLQVIDILALMGDKVDNIPGCPGVGSVTAIKLVKQFHSVENLIERADEVKGALGAKVKANVEQIKFSKFLATIKTDVPVEFDENDLKREDMDKAALRHIFEELEFKTLITRLIDNNNESGIKQDTAITTAAKKPMGGQQTLFDFGGNNEPEAASMSKDVVTSKTCINDTPHNYNVITERADVEALVSQLCQLPKVGVYIVADSDDFMTARICGIAFSGEKGNAAYVVVPLDSTGRETVLEAVKSIFENDKVTIVSADVKRDMILLRNAGINLVAPYYDIAVAHYLIQPEMNHSTNRLADIYLDYESIPLVSLTGAKGKSYKPVGTLAPDVVCDMACELADCTLRLMPILDAMVVENGVSGLMNDIEFPLIEVLADMEMTGVRVDTKSLNDYSRILTEQVDTIEAECFELAGGKFNVSSPAQVGEVLFGKLQLDDKAKKTRSGQYSTTEEILVKLKHKHPIVAKILELRGIRKLLSTYANALPELINPATGRIHTTYNQTVTATGRLSSTNPNMQNIPVRNDEGREIRKAFIPADGNVFFSADYSQIELRLVADLSKDETMVKAFRDGDDIHALTAAKIYHEPLESVTPDQRRKAKTANFGILYGISAFGLSERLEIPRSEAKMLIDGYFATFPSVQEYIDTSVAKAKEQGYVTTLFGRRRMLPDINSRNAVVRNFSERNAINAPIQGTAADIIKLAMVRIYHRFKQEGIKSKMIMQVHDELNFDVIPGELDRVTSIVATEMQGAYTGGVPLIASHGAAQNWLEAH